MSSYGQMEKFFLSHLVAHIMSHFSAKLVGLLALFYIIFLMNLTEHILFVEYGNVIINCLSKSPVSTKEMKLHA